MNVANKPDTKNARQRTSPSELILVWSHVTSVFQGLCLSHSMGRVGENPGNEVEGQGIPAIKNMAPAGYFHTRKQKKSLAV